MVESAGSRGGGQCCSYHWVLEAFTLLSGLALLSLPSSQIEGSTETSPGVCTCFTFWPHLKKNCNGRIPCLSELKSASRPCMKFFPRCVFPNVDWPIGDNSYCLLPLLYVFSLSYILLQLKLRWSQKFTLRKRHISPKCLKSL